MANLELNKAIAELEEQHRNYRLAASKGIAELKEKLKNALQVTFETEKEADHLSAHIERLNLLSDKVVTELEWHLSIAREKDIDDLTGLLNELHKARLETPKQSLSHIKREAFKDGYEQGHYTTVESMGFDPEDAADDYIQQLKDGK